LQTLRSVGGRVFFRLPFFCPDKRKVTIGFPRPCSWHAFSVTFSLLLETKKK